MITPDDLSPSENKESADSSSIRHRGPEGLGEEVACALEQNTRSGQGGTDAEDQRFLQAWFKEKGCLIPQELWSSWHPVSEGTLEHEVRLRLEDRRAMKKTLPGSFGFVPTKDGETWVPIPATPAEYLHRMHLQNTIFGDEICLEGGMIHSGPSMIIGGPPNGFSFVISQPWLEAADNRNQFPSEAEIHEFLSGIGFQPLRNAFYGWQSSDASLVILDAKPDNFISTPEGILPIDLLLTETLLAA
jgi:hypothetical protein